MQPWIQHADAKYRVDFLVHYDGGVVAVELDGHEFHKTKEQRGADASKDRWLQARGIRVVRFTGSQVFGTSRGASGNSSTSSARARPVPRGSASLRLLLGRGKRSKASGSVASLGAWLAARLHRCHARARVKDKLATLCYMVSTFMAVGGFLVLGAWLAGWVSWVLAPVLWIAGVPLVWLGNVLSR